MPVPLRLFAAISLPVFGALLGLVGHVPAGGALAKPETVRITTIDSVTLVGQFYATNKKTAPVVVFLPALGENSKLKAWTSLAEELQKKGYNVLAFDYRGVGESTSVEPEFWSQTFPYNTATLIKKSPNKNELDFKSFDKRYYPVLVNDIAAVKSYLDRTKNDSGVCNTANMILIGAGEGATLGALWLNSEYHRHRLLTTPFGSQLDKRPEGKDVIGCIWLTISPKLGTRDVNLAALLQNAAQLNTTPMVFMYSDGDTKAKDIARYCEKTLKKDKERQKYFGTFPVPNSAKLTGSDLLQKSLGTDQAIVDYLDQVVQAKGNEWGNKEFSKGTFIWRRPGVVNPNLPNAILPASNPAEPKNLVYSTYEMFLK